MRLTELLHTEKVTVSCEMYPPKQQEQLAHYKELAAELAALKPAYMSVTYGATGGTSAYTTALADEIRNVCKIPTLAHLTCVSSTREKVAAVLADLKAKNIENILALRGDIPANPDFLLPKHYKHAAELIADIKTQGNFCIGGACYTEGHPESKNIASDLMYLKEKVDAGCEFLTTQMFFDNDILYRFMYKAQKYGIDVPIVAGVMPITSKGQVERSISLSGCMIPKRFLAAVDRFGDEPAAMRQAGIAYATDQIIDLIANGVNHVHIYTMNKPDIAKAILDNLSDIYIR